VRSVSLGLACTFAIAIGIASACGGGSAGSGGAGGPDGPDGGGAGDGAPAGFAPPGPKEGEVQLVAPVVPGIPAGGDVVWCSYVASPFGGDVDVVGTATYQSKTGHHAVFSRATNGVPVGTSRACTAEDMPAATAGASYAIAQVPDGVGLRVAHDDVLLVRTHWVNTTSSAVDGQTVFDVAVRAPDPSRVAGRVVTVHATKVDLEPRRSTDLVTECTADRDLALVILGGHMHALGTHLKIEQVPRGGAATTIYDFAWQNDYATNAPVRKFTLAAPLRVAAGDLLRVTCTWNNGTDRAVTFPDEMCGAFGVYAPGTTDLECADGVWSPP